MPAIRRPRGLKTALTLIEDHERIIGAAGHLPVCIADKSCKADELAVTLDTLTGQVHDHLAVENAIIAHDYSMTMWPWAETWQNGQNGFVRLRSDWLAFLDAWDRRRLPRTGVALRTRQITSAAACASVYKQKPRPFYATALQNGAINLR